MKDNLKGKFIAILGPSGSGKSTLINMLIDKYPKLKFAISCTTREIRDHEKQGVNYFYLTNKEFEEKLNNNDLLEHAFVHSKFYYGLLKSTVLDSLKNGDILIKDIEFKGLFQLKKILGVTNFKSIFIMPPSKDEIIKRLNQRAHINYDELKKRLDSIDNEMNLKSECDLIFNPVIGNIEKTFENFEKDFFKLLNLNKENFK